MENKSQNLSQDHGYRINNDWINPRELEAKLQEIFGTSPEEPATIVVDNEYQKIYLAVWERNEQAEQAMIQWFKQRYQHARINKIARDISRNDFAGARKIGRHHLIEYFRGRPDIVPAPDYPYILS